MPQALVDLKKNMHGHPCRMSRKTWEYKIDRMINAFKVGREIQNYSYRNMNEYMTALKEFRRDFNMIRMHFFDLWD